MQRVNRISVSVGSDKDECSMISLYKTNTKVAELTNRDIDVPDFKDSGTDRNTYQSYCKDVVTNLLQNGGIEGYYFDAKQDSSNETSGKKYGTAEFEAEAVKSVQNMLAEMTEGTDITYIVSTYNNFTDVADRYGDGNVKFGLVIVRASITRGANTLNSRNIEVLVELKSGQMCKPKEFTMGSEKYQFNITSILKATAVGK